MSLSRSVVRSLSRLTNCLAGALARGVAVEEQELLWVRTSQGGPQHVPVGNAATLSMSLPPRGPVPVRTSLRTRSGCLSDQILGDHAAHREREHVDLLEPQRRDEGVGVVGGFFDGARHLPVDAPTPLLSKAIDVAGLGDRVDDSRIPIVQGRREVDEEHHRDAALWDRVHGRRRWCRRRSPCVTVPSRRT